jgi:hypothetical protein
MRKGGRYLRRNFGQVFGTRPQTNGWRPATVTAVPRLQDDLCSLMHLMTAPTPPIRYVRPTHITVAIYRFGDASGQGFGSSFALPDGCTIFRHGLWGRDADDESSNFKELHNLVSAIEEGVASGELRSTELFIFTDNSTAEGAYYKGNSSSRRLFDLVLRLRTIDMDGQLKIHLTHVTGTRMIHQGTDSLSRGNYTDGVMMGQPMLSFVPLNRSVFDQSPPLLSWVQSWIPLPDIQPLSPEGWFQEGHGVQGGYYNSESEKAWVPKLTRTQWFLWAPPPAAAGAAIDQLSISRQKRPHLNHIFVCSCMLTHMWRKKLYKLADAVFELPAGLHPCWPRSMHEPLIIGLTLRFIRHFPWQLRNTASVLELVRSVQSLWKDPKGDVRPFLCQLCDLPALLDSLPERVVQGMLHPTPPG